MKQFVSVETASAEVRSIEKQVITVMDGHHFAVVLTALGTIVATVLGGFSEETGQPLEDLAEQFDCNLRFLLELADDGVTPTKQDMN